MMKKNQIIHHFTMKDDKPTLNFDNELKKFSSLDKIYPFKIQYIHDNSEYLYNFNLPRYTECFFILNTLFIVIEHLQTEIVRLAKAVYFIMPGNIRHKDLEAVFEFIKDFEDIQNKIKKMKVSIDKTEVRHFIASTYLFEQKLVHENIESSFDKMMLKSRRIITKIKPVKIKVKDIDYLLEKEF